MEDNTDMFFATLKDLYLRIKPALTARASELKREGFTYINENDIWNYFSESKWKSTSNLCLSDMVSDIFNVDEVLVDDYVKAKLSDKNRVVYLENN